MEKRKREKGNTDRSSYMYMQRQLALSYSLSGKLSVAVLRTCIYLVQLQLVLPRTPQLFEGAEDDYLVHLSLCSSVGIVLCVCGDHDTRI